MNGLHHIQQQVLDRKRPIEDRDYLDAFRRRTFTEPDFAEVFHEYTKIDAIWKHRARRTRETVERATGDVEATLEPDYAVGDVVELPDDVGLDAEFEEAVHGSRDANPTERSVSKRDLAALLGVSLSSREGSSSRAYPSFGAHYPCEVYLAVLDVDDLGTGLYHYNPKRHRLRRLPRDANCSLEEVVDEAYLGPAESSTAAADSDVVVLVSSAFWRARLEHGPRGYRYALQESGHLMQNLLLAARATGVRARPRVEFKDSTLNAMCDLDGVDEAVVHTATIGRSTRKETR